VNHQVRVIVASELISERVLRHDISATEREKLLLTQNIRKFVEEKYDIPNSKSYSKYYNLSRKALGWNITIAPELSLKPESFDFFPLGSFDYLGFFSEPLIKEWAARYEKLGFDVYISEIGGYSTLGWFEDPLYSTQLDSSEYGLARLLSHEIAHEKLYFKNDTTFSELLASFIETKLANDYVIAMGKKRPPPRQMYERDLILEARQTLAKLYASNISDEIKRARKQEILSSLKRELGSVSITLNNASLAQFHRYTPKYQKFETTFAACDDSEKYRCWFKKLFELRDLNQAQRRAWLEN